MQVNSIGSGSDYASMREMMEEMKARMFAKLDANSDGGIEKSELTEIAERTGIEADELIAKYDEDQDGLLNTDEMDTMMRATRPASPPPPPPDMGGIGEDGEDDINDLLDELIAQLDETKSLTVAERTDLKDKLLEYIRQLSEAYDSGLQTGALVDYTV